jgi:hypothetical protein
VAWPGGADHDPFWDPESEIPARWRFDRRTGQDAYLLPWVGYGSRFWVNGPYSKGHPRETAKRCAVMADQHGLEILNLCPAAPGSAYWRTWVWPFVDLVIWCGRLSFKAGRDLHDAKTGELTHKRGEVVKGNRTEISLLYTGPDAHRIAAVFGREYAYTVNR